MTSLWSLSAQQLAAGIAKGEFSSSDVVDAHLKRIEEVNPKLNAVTRVLADSARSAAESADEAVTQGAELGAFHGVPFSIKENIDVIGSPTTEGLNFFAEAMPEQNDPCVERMLDAGAIPLARTNLPDLGLRVNTESQLHGATHNPWRRGFTAGGSSGGEGSALASGMSPIGLGNDIGGSLRNPAFCNGVASLKPSFGRIPRAESIEPTSPSLAGQLMSVQGPMARHVSDLRAAYAVLAGQHVRDPWSMPMPLEGAPLERPIRVAVVAEPPGGTTHPSVVEGVRRAADALADAGYDVVDVVPPDLEESMVVWANWLQTDLAAAGDILRMVMGPDALVVLDQFAEVYPTLDSQGTVALQVKRHEIARRWAAFQAEHPITLGPVWTGVQFRHGWDIASFENGQQVIELIRFTVVMNLLGLPSVAVPVGVSDGLPQGVQVVGGRYREDLCLDAAEAIEAALGRITPIDPRD